MSFFAELKRRNVFRVGIAYLVVAWLVLQVADVVLNNVDAPGWIFTVIVLLLGIGLPFAILFAWAFEMTPEGLKREHEVDRSQSITRQTGRKLDFTIIALLVLVVVYLLADKFVLSPDSTAPSRTAEMGLAEPDAVVETQAKSIAVLPFANMSGDADNEYFSDGISEEILNALAKVKELKVAGRTSSFAFKGRSEDLRTIGDTLGVNHILEGSVRKAENTVRITAQLIQVEDGFHLWSETYDRELTNIFAIQDEISAAILSALKAELIGEEQIASTRTGTESYEKYLLARQRIYSRGKPELENAMVLLDEVIRADPQFAPAWAQRGIVTLLLSENNYGDIPILQSRADAKRDLEKSLELDPALAEGWAGLGLYHYDQSGADNQATAIEYLERALAINPSLVNASNWLQLALDNQGRVGEALAILEGLFGRDPLYYPAIGNLVFLYGRLNQLDKAEAALERIRPYFAEHHQLAQSEARVRNWSGRPGEALAFARKAHELAPANENNALVLSFTLLSLGEFDEVLEIETADPWVKVLVLRYLGRVEEAAMLAREWAGIDPGPYIGLLAQTGRFGELIQYVEAGWPDLEAADRDLAGEFGFGHWNFLFTAWAYRETGDLEKYRQALQLARAEHDQQFAQGAASRFFWEVEAVYWTLAGDEEKAIDCLERAVDMGYASPPRLAKALPVFKPLEGDPRYVAAQARAYENLRAQRAAAGLAPFRQEHAL